MKKVSIFILVFILVLITGCKNKNDELSLADIIDDYRFSEDISYSIKDKDNIIFSIDNYILSQGFIEELFTDKPISKYNINHKFSLSSSEVVEIKAKLDDNKKIDIVICHDGSIYLDDTNSKYVGKKGTVNYSTFTSMKDLNDILSIDGRHSALFFGDASLYTSEDGSLKSDVVLKSYEEIKTVVRNRINDIKEKGYNSESYPNIHSDKIISKAINDLKSKYFYDEVKTILQDYQVLMLKYPYYGIQKKSIEYNFENQKELRDWLFLQDKVNLYGSNGGGFIYNYDEDIAYAVSKTDITNLTLKFDEATKKVEKKISDFKNLISEWWQS